MKPENVDYSKLPENVVRILEEVENRSKARETEQVLGGVMKEIEELKTQMTPTMRLELDNLEVALQPLLETMQYIADKEQPEMPDYSQPVVDTVNELGKTLGAAIRGINVSPKVDVQAPNVTVDAPQVDVDLSGVERIMAKLPAQLETAIKKMPVTEVPEQDYTEITDKLSEMLQWLESIDNASRIKPQAPSTVKVTSTSGTEITSFQDGDGTPTRALTGAYGASVITNARTKFRDGFANPNITQPKADVWDLINEDSGNAFPHIINRGGNALGSAYLRISLSPFIQGSEVSLTSVDSFSFPLRFGIGVSTSQRFSGQEVFLGLVGTNPDGTVPTANSKADQSLSGTASVTNNVATITLTNHGFMGTDRVNIFGCAEHRMNVGPVLVTVADANTITVPVTIANGTYSLTGGTIRYIDPTRDVENYGGLLIDNTTVTNGSQVARRNGAKPRIVNSTIATTTAVQSSGSQYTDSFNSASTQEMFYGFDEFKYRSFPADSQGSMSGYGKFTGTIPEEDIPYKIRIKARNLTGISRPIARISSIAKTGTTTATVTTDVAHGLVTGDYVQLYGVRDQTNFPNLTAQTIVASAPTSTTFTIVIGTASTTTSSGGTVFQNEGSVLSTALGAAIQSIVVNNGIMTLTFNSTVSAPLPGEYWHVHGLDIPTVPGLALYEGGFKVLRSSAATTVDLDATGLPNLASTNTGGSLIKRTDIRIHFVRELDYTRNYVEVMGGAGNVSDANNAVPVTIAASAGVPAVQSTGSATTQWNAAGYAGLGVNDIVSAAITSTATSAAITPGLIANIGAYAQVYSLFVTAVSGTNPTMDVVVQESADNGTTWYDIYHFPRVIATLPTPIYSPPIPTTLGTRIRYVRTIGGTTPSFTNAVWRSMHSRSAPYIRQYFDRTVVVNTLNSTTPVYQVAGSNSIMATLVMGAITTTAPVITLEGSEDNLNWYPLGSSPTITGVATSTAVNYIVNVVPAFVRGRVSTAGSGATLTYLAIKAVGM